MVAGSPDWAADIVVTPLPPVALSLGAVVGRRG